MYGGTHIARPDRTVDSQGTGAKWRQATWLAFLVRQAIDHGRVLGLQALQRGDVRPEKVQIMIPKLRAVHFTAEEIKSEARRAPIFSLQDVGKLFRQLYQCFASDLHMCAQPDSCWRLECYGQHCSRHSLTRSLRRQNSPQI